MSDIKEPGFYMGEVEVSINSLHEAIEAAERLVGKHVYSNVGVHGDKEQCERFASDVVAAAQMLLTLTKAITEGRPVPGGIH
jgi:hypothetical protein